MKKIVHRSQTRGTANYGWLQARYSFSFANYSDPERVQFGALRVLNDDIVAPSMGFGRHPHNNMEIVSIPLKGALKHKDNMDHIEVIRPGEIQVMSAGSGIEHSEVNVSTKETMNLLQVWVLPEVRDVAPRYDQKTFDEGEKDNKFLTVVSPKDKNDGNALWIHQQAYFNLGNFNSGKEIAYSFNDTSNGAYLFVIEGDISVDHELLTKRDAIGIWDTETVSLKANTDSKLLLIEVPMN